MTDFINYPHYHDPKRPCMSMHDRAAQFMPFKSLTGYHNQIDDKAMDVLDTEWQHVEYDEDYLDSRGAPWS